MGLFGGSSNSKQTTNITDNRNTVQNGNAVSGTGNTVNVTDGGAVSRALDSIDIANANQGKSFDSLLSTITDIFGKANSTVAATTSAATTGLANAMATVTAARDGTMDSKTMIALAGIAAVAIGLLIWSNKK